jgi:anti-sigma factor RsiW
MTCAATRRRLAAFHDRELSIADQIAVQAHLAECAACRADAGALEAIGDSLRLVASQTAEGWPQELAGLPSGVVSRLAAERNQSVVSKIGRLFEDMHLVWAAGGATVATFACGVVIYALLLAASRERPTLPDSLAGMVASLSTVGSNENPVRMDARQLLLPRAQPDMVMPTAVVNYRRDHDGGFALSATVATDGTVSNVELLEAHGNARDRALRRDSRELLAILDAASTARFQPARYYGSPVAVSMVWVVAHTTVRAKIPDLPTPDTWRSPAVPSVDRPAPKNPSPDDSVEHRPLRPRATLPAVGV